MPVIVDSLDWTPIVRMSYPDDLSRPKFGDPQWGTRLQMLWIAFTAIYSWAGDRYPIIITSSSLMLAAGTLLLAVLAHIIASADQDRVKRTLLVAFTASLFLVNTSVHTFKDHLAALFAGLFACMLGGLLWGRSTDALLKRFQYLAFVSMSLALIPAATGLGATLALKRFLGKNDLMRQYVFAPQGTAALCGLAIGLILGGRILSNRTAGYNSLEPKGSLRITLETLLLCIGIALAIGISNDQRVRAVFGSSVRGWLGAYSYAVILVLPAALYLAYLHRSSTTSQLFSFHSSMILCLLGWTGGALNAINLAALSNDFRSFVIRICVTEAVPAAIFGAAMGLAFYIVNRVSDLVMATAYEPAGQCREKVT